MEDRTLAQALRSREPKAVAALYDAYADRLYAYCWFRLRSTDAALVALRDTLVCAEARVQDLRDPGRLGAWLYALARVECRRRQPAHTARPDIPVASHDQADVDLRLMAWRAVTALPPLSRELLDLRHRHDLAVADIADVVGLPVREVEELLDQASALLEPALIAEILAHDGPYECEYRGEVLRGRRGEIGADLRENLVRHTAECEMCARRLPRKVAPKKVFELLPAVSPPESQRLRIMSCFTDPELADYRLLAAGRLPPLDARGFPEQCRRRAPVNTEEPGLRGWQYALLAVAAAVLVTAVVTGVIRWLAEGEARTARTAGSGSGPVRGSQSIGDSPSVSPPPDAGGANRPVTGNHPYDGRNPDPAPIALPHPPSHSHRSGSGGVKRRRSPTTHGPTTLSPTRPGRPSPSASRPTSTPKPTPEPPRPSAASPPAPSAGAETS